MSTNPHADGNIVAQLKKTLPLDWGDNSLGKTLAG